jgi:DnaJ-class molecular chaperone
MDHRHFESILTGGTQINDDQENQRKPKKEMKRRHLVEKAYKLLGVNSEATMDEIQSSYRRMTLKYHPDKGGSYANWHKLDKAMANIKKERNIPT